MFRGNRSGLPDVLGVKVHTQFRIMGYSVQWKTLNLFALIAQSATKDTVTSGSLSEPVRTRCLLWVTLSRLLGTNKSSRVDDLKKGLCFNQKSPAEIQGMLRTFKSPCAPRIICTSEASKAKSNTQTGLCTWLKILHRTIWNDELEMNSGTNRAWSWFLLRSAVVASRPSEWSDSNDPLTFLRPEARKVSVNCWIQNLIQSGRRATHSQEWFLTGFSHLYKNASCEITPCLFKTFGGERSCVIEQEPFLFGENPFFYHDASTYDRFCDLRVVESPLFNQKCPTIQRTHWVP